MLRIIAGDLRRRQIETARDGATTRPLPDRVRGSIFNMLQGHVEGQPFVDVFAGSGSFGFEAISRGASECVFVERDRTALKLLRRNIEMLGIEGRARIAQADALGPAALASMPRPTHVLLFDPPYPMMQDEAQRSRVIEQFRRCAAMLDDTGYALLRTPWPFADAITSEEGEIIEHVAVPLEFKGLEGPETHVYGSTAVHWYMRATS
jgi:16S rRNA (guanine(966)-N(2))-methyltransferase RsmD